MVLNVLREKDFLAGVIFVTIGSFFAIGALDYGIGSTRRMGPGYFPLVLGVILAMIGLILAGKAAWEKGGHFVGGLYLRPVLALCAAIVSFAVLLEETGLVPACLATALIAGFGSRETTFLSSLVVAVVMAVSCSLLFVEFLGLPMALWRF